MKATKTYKLDHEHYPEFYWCIAKAICCQTMPNNDYRSAKDVTSSVTANLRKKGIPYVIRYAESMVKAIPSYVLVCRKPNSWHKQVEEFAKMMSVDIADETTKYPAILQFKCEHEEVESATDNN